MQQVSKHSGKGQIDRGRVAVVLMLMILGVGLTLLWGRSPLIPLDSTASDGLPVPVVVAPADPQQLAALVRQHEALRARLGMTVAPADPQQLAALVQS
jgi:hypothetical protein